MQYAGVERSFSNLRLPTSGTIPSCPGENAPLERMEYWAALDALIVGWMRWNPDVTLAALKHENLLIQRAAVETLSTPSDLFEKYTDEQLVEQNKNLILAAFSASKVDRTDIKEMMETVGYLTSHEVFSDKQIMKAVEDIFGQDFIGDPETFIERLEEYLDNPEDYMH